MQCSADRTIEFARYRAVLGLIVVKSMNMPASQFTINHERVKARYAQTARATKPLAISSETMLGQNFVPQSIGDHKGRLSAPIGETFRRD